jgi:DNA polymerase III delta prime subunit
MEQPSFAEHFIKSALKAEKLSHALVLTGEDSFSQYGLALKTAKLLNCENKSLYLDLPDYKCSCLNCSWINQNRHPAVITISPIDCTYANKKGEVKGVISIDVARKLRKELGISSSYHRVIIFTNAVEGKDYEKKYSNCISADLSSFNSPAPTDRELKADETRNSWMPMPLNHKVLQAAAVNTLLKTIEEPGENITFFFLTRDRDDIIETIISRCQVLPVSSKKEEKDCSFLNSDFLENIFPNDYSEALNFSEKLEQVTKDEGYKIEDLLSIMQENIQKNAQKDLKNIEQIRLFSKITALIELTKTQLRWHVSPIAALDNLFIAIMSL